MKIYLASSFRFVKTVSDLARWLELRGHTITCRWWLADYKVLLGDIPDGEWYGKAIVRAIYQRSFTAIKAADVLILVSPEKTSFNGANVEVGIALGLGKPVISLGSIERSGMYEPVIQCATEKQMIEVLNEFEHH